MPGISPRLRAQASEALVPITVMWTLPYKCNLMCAHCYQHLHRSEDLSTEEVFQVMDELARLGSLYLTLSGGEPLARKDFWQILEGAFARRFAVTLFSNGTLIDEARADRLASFPLAGVEVSLHGGDAQMHDRIVGQPGAFMRTLRAIDRLEARGVKLLVKMSVMKSNVEEAEKLYRMFEGRPKIKVTVSTRLFPRDDGDLTPCDMHISEEDELRLYRMQLGRRAEDAGRKLLSMPVVNFQPERSRTCGAGRTLIVILPNGDVLPCVHLGGLKMGNVRERPVSAIWLDNDAVRELRAITLASFKECQSCELISVCPHCPAMSLVETGRLDGWSSQICQATKTFWGAAREKLRAEGKELML